jgi:hypothetical protein
MSFSLPLSAQEAKAVMIIAYKQLFKALDPP